LPGAWPKQAEVEATKFAHHLALRPRSLVGWSWNRRELRRASCRAGGRRRPGV